MRYVMRRRQSGRMRYYFRRRGCKTVRLPDDRDSAEFRQAYATALAAGPPVKATKGVKPGWRHVASMGDWTIWHRLDADGGWHNFVLRLDPKVKAKKHMFWLGWNAQAERLARSGDAKALQEHRPAIARWVVSACRQVWPKTVDAKARVAAPPP